MSVARTEFVYAGRVIVVPHTSLDAAHRYAWHALANWQGIKYIDIRSPRGEPDRLIVTVKRRRTA